MSKGDELRRNAEECAELARGAKDEPSRKRYRRIRKAWQDMARTQDWLDGKQQEMTATTTLKP